MQADAASVGEKAVAVGKGKEIVDVGMETLAVGNEAVADDVGDETIAVRGVFELHLSCSLFRIIFCVFIQI